MKNLKNEISLSEHYHEVGSGKTFDHEIKAVRSTGSPLDEYHMLRRWCAVHCRKRFTHFYAENGSSFWFEDRRDAAHFKLVWS